MRARILLYSVGIILISVAVTSFISVGITVNNYIDGKKGELHAACALLGSEMATEHGSAAELTYDDYAVRYAEATGFRVTIIGTDGEVLADSRSRENIVYMDNHANREEVAAALAEGAGHARRQSESFGREYIYEAILQALPGGDALVVRFAMEVDKAKIAAEHAQPTAALSALIGILLGVLIAALYTRRLTQPIREMERELEETFEKYKQADNIRKDFVANVTHELKTPLTSISGFAETLQGSAGEKPEVRARFLAIISLEAARLSRLIDDTLIIADIESGRHIILPDGDIDVKQAVEEVIESLHALAESEGIEMHFDTQYEMHIGGDAGRFKQLVLNLVENAIKYSGDGKHVYIKAVREEDGRVCVSVRDEGIGIAPGHIPRLFERFYRVDKSRSREAGGTGLGLAIVKHIAMLFDAELSVKSELGAGSIFTIRFPAD
ncbi:MAG: ATP-binding protein [Clostridiales bacterium]|nr:ATP-binding protein [Clostridiales bacterium]